MSLQGNSIYRTESQIVSDVLAAWAARIPDVAISEDTIVRIWTEVFANSGSGFFLGLQLLHDDLFLQSASFLALQSYGDQYGRQQKAGDVAAGQVTFTGAGGAFIAAGSQVGAPRPALGDTLVFETTDDATIPNPGTSTALVAVDSGTDGNVGGTVEYASTFVTAAGETALGAASTPLVLAAAHQVNLTEIPLGGDGTTGRKIYRSENGGLFQFVALIDDNTTTTYTDNVADGSLGGNPPDVSTAEAVTVDAKSVDAGVAYNVGVGSITSLVSVDGDVNSVTNAAAFTGGVDPEAVEVFRDALVQWVRNPQNGSSPDLVAWATSIDGVDSAAVFKNVNLSGTTEKGSVVVRIAGPGGTLPDSDLIAEVQGFFDSKVLANITIYVADFDANTVDVDVTATPVSGYELADITPTIQAAIAAYIDSIPPGQTVYVAGLYWAAFNQPGVETVAITSPTDDVTSTATQKAVAGDVTVS